MRALMKFPLMVVLCCVATTAGMTPRAMAGRVPISLSGSGSSGVGDALVPASDSRASSAQVSVQISRGMISALRTIESQGTVSSIGDRSLSISPQQISTIATVLSATGDRVEPALQMLEQQLSAELGGTNIDLAILGSSSGNLSSGDLSSAVTAANELILSLNRAELIAAIESPTFMAILRLLGGANEAIADGESGIVLVEGGGGISGILRMSLLQ